MTDEIRTVMDEIATPAESSPGRFSKKNFNKLMKAILNDPSFQAKVAISRNKELAEVEEVAVSKNFRKFLKGVLEKAGMDKAESDMVMDGAFVVDNVDGLYEFFAEVMYQYMTTNNKFDLLQKEDMKAPSLYIQEVEGGISEPKDARNPSTGEIIGRYRYKTEKHRVVKVSSPCPPWLRSRLDP